MSSNEKKNATLGMSHGTATNRLRKRIMFSLLCRLKENVCYRCKEVIEAVDELSVEHKKPWEGISADLFWDLENISFSHIQCNRPHRLSGGNRLEYPEGKGYCGICKKFLPRDYFWFRSVAPNGLDSRCKECRKKVDERVNHARKISVEN